MKILEITSGSLAEQHQLKVGDDLLSINGIVIEDEIALEYQSNDEFLELEINREGEEYVIEIEKDFAEPLGIKVEPIRFRSCGNHCIFCFVDQNPPGMRPSLYLKDEEFRLSFLYGNYVTLTNLSRRDADRIVQQRLSPLYVSVHAINPATRQRLLGLKKDDRLLEKIQFLTRHRIEIHTQIVLCPGYNDGAVLAETVETLARFYPFLNSIAIVPLGLTRHRQHLPAMPPVTPVIAEAVIKWAENWTKNFYKSAEQHLLYLADEFYLLAGQPLPPTERYDDFPQFDNGVGMSRTFLDDFERQSETFPPKIVSPRKITFVTGKLAFPLLEKWVLPRLNQIENLQVTLVAVTNHFYGESVTVSGLLTGQDIFSALRDTDLGDRVYLPPNCLNFDDLFLDDWTPAQLEDKLGCPVQILNSDFQVIFD